jgi:hypothetical protein
MTKSIFSVLAVALLAVVLNSGAQAFCGLDKHRNPIPAVAVADDTGTVVVKTRAGKPVRIRGFEPNADICRNLPLPSADWKCPGGLARLDEVREPKFCKRGYVEGRTCYHVVCSGKGT